MRSLIEVHLHLRLHTHHTTPHQVRKEAFPSTAPYYTHAPATHDSAEDVAALHTKVVALTSLQRLVSHPSLARLQPEAAGCVSMWTSCAFVHVCAHACMLAFDTGGWGAGWVRVQFEVPLEAVASEAEGTVVL